MDNSAFCLFKLKVEEKKEQYNNPFNRKNKEPWYSYLAMILFAPLIVLVIPYILIDEHIKDKAQKKRDAEWEEEKRKEELKKKESENDFLKSVSLKDYDIIIGCVLLGKSVNELVEANRYADVFRKLDAIKLEKGCSLQVQKCKEEWPGDSSKLYVMDLNQTSKRDYDIYKHIHVEDSYNGAWQVYLLHSLWHILPHFQHGCYAYRTPVFDMNDIQNIELGFSDEKIDIQAVSVVDKNSFMPTISKYQDKYFVTACYWSDWSGLVRELVEITIRNNMVETINDVSSTVEYEYNCGIMF